MKQVSKSKRNNSQKRNIARLLLILFFIIVGLFTILIISFNRPPTENEVKNQFGNRMLVYKVLDGKPYMLFTTSPNDNHIRFDTLKLDLKYTLVNLRPEILWSGAWYAMPKVSEVGSVGYGYCVGVEGLLPPNCKDTDVFGEITSDEVKYLELFYEDKWRRFSVSRPGFIIRIKNYTSGISNARFLTDNGNILLEIKPEAEPKLRNI